MKIRLRYLVYPQFQMSLLLINAIANLFLFTYLFTRIKFYFDSMIQNGKEIGLPADHIYFQFLSDQKQHLGSEFLLALLVSLVLTTLLTLWLSHRMAGPIIRLRNHLKKVADGEKYSEIKFRKNDYFQEIPLYLNQAVEKLTKNEPQ